MHVVIHHIYPPPPTHEQCIISPPLFYILCISEIYITAYILTVLIYWARDNFQNKYYISWSSWQSPRLQDRSRMITPRKCIVSNYNEETFKLKKVFYIYMYIRIISHITEKNMYHKYINWFFSKRQGGNHVMGKLICCLIFLFQDVSLIRSISSSSMIKMCFL